MTNKNDPRRINHFLIYKRKTAINILILSSALSENMHNDAWADTIVFPLESNTTINSCLNASLRLRFKICN